MTPFKLSEELLDQINSDIVAQNNKALQTLVKEYHYADLAEIFEALQIDQAVYLFKLIDSEKSADMLPELDEDVRESILDALSSEEIATEIEELDTDDAVDNIAVLPDEQISNHSNDRAGPDILAVTLLGTPFGTICSLNL